jgi:ribosome maturation factor RimP
VDAESLVKPVVEQAGYELVELTYGGQGDRRSLRVAVDGDEGLDLDSLAALSEAIARRLDLEDFGDRRYELEVSSPGIERPLRTPAQFGRAVGSLVRVRTAEALDGVQVHEGVIIASDDVAVTIAVDGGPRTIAYAAIVAARTVADWDAELKGTKV